MLLASSVGQAQLLISELLFQPLSHEAEYVELHNVGSQTLDLSAYHIVRWVGDSLGKHYPLPAVQVAPGDYVALTSDASSVSTHYLVGNLALLVECSLPPFPNEGGSVVLSTADSTVCDRFDYLPSMHSPLLRGKVGVALERRSFDAPTNSPSNWMSASSTSGYGTPTMPNSQSSEWLVREADFEYSTAVVSPGSEADDARLVVSYRVDRQPLMADVRLFAPDGREVRRLLDRALLGASGTFQWDGRAAGGSPLPRGRYLLLILLYDHQGYSQTLRHPVVLY